MKKLLLLVVMFLGLSTGCGPGATDTSGAAPPATPESTQQELLDAQKKGDINPSTYGKGS